MWSALRGRQIEGYKFRPQVPIGPCFADFACLSARLVVEIDGEGHEEIADRRKDDHMSARGFRVVRIPAADIDASLDDALNVIFLALSPVSSLPCGEDVPLAQRAGQEGADKGEFFSPGLARLMTGPAQGLAPNRRYRADLPTGWGGGPVQG